MACCCGSETVACWSDPVPDTLFLHITAVSGDCTTFFSTGTVTMVFAHGSGNWQYTSPAGDLWTLSCIGGNWILDLPYKGSDGISPCHVIQSIPGGGSGAFSISFTLTDSGSDPPCCSGTVSATVHA